MKLDYIGATVIPDRLILRKSSVTISGDEIATAPATSWLYLTAESGGVDNLKGLGAGTEGQVVFITVAASQVITLQHNTATTYKPLYLSTGGNWALRNAYDFVIAVYNATPSGWDILVPNRSKRQLKITATSLAVAAGTNRGWTSWEAPDTVTVKATLHYLGDCGVAQSWTVERQAAAGGAWTEVIVIPVTASAVRTESATEITLSEGQRLRLIHTNTPNAGGVAGDGVEVTFDEV